MADAETPKAGDGPVLADETDKALLDAVDQADGAQPAVTLAEPVRRTEAPAQAVKPPAPPAKASSGGGFLAALLGGALAAIGGFALAHYDVIPISGSNDLAAIETQLAAQAAEAATLRSELAQLTSRPSDADLAPRLEAAEAALAKVQATPPADLTQQLTALESRIAAIETMPAAASGGVAPSVITALQAEIATLKDQGSAASADLAKVAAEAEAMAKAAVARAAVGQVQAALDSGAPFAAALAELDAATVPASLSALAEAGVPTRAALADSFAPAARAALEAALRADMGDTWTERVGTFLRNQTGARSLTPREGADPDAILSRAEAAVAAGDLPAALTEIAALPDVARAELAPWEAMAQQRVAAEADVAALAAAIGQ